ncbi:GtrA family protein [Priestia sp. JV24]|uniref:GtrA family protein n=1 Tax=Priestia TaxID=2800373 RepID=UPI0021D663EF|nr:MULTISPECIES: GtrA family protein [Priestia]MCU7707975.1 GtrA family protein [Priestia megaterium]MCW1047601.1 GtrA family protein [Priestia sp. JV24]
MIKFLKFGFVGIMNTLLTIISYLVLIHFDMNYILANVLSYFIGVINSYYWNKSWVFQATVHKWMLAQFFIVNLITLAINTSCLFLLVHYTPANPIIGQLLSTCIGMFINFFLNKIWTFKHTNNHSIGGKA